MQTECNADSPGFAYLESRAVLAGSDGGAVTSDAALLLGAVDRDGPLRGLFWDVQRPQFIEHNVPR